jgi:O-antigen/teichoic acid export membrane protein
MLSRTRILNMLLRACTLGARFVFVFFLAKFLDAKAVGYYGLFTATVGYFLYLVGLDFYTYTTREILKAQHEQRGQMLKGQASLSALLYIVVVPLAVWMLPQAQWPSELLLWFFPILVLEHLNQEISRLLIALSEQITASLILFMRQGSWALAIVGLMAVNANMRHLQAVMACWLTAGLIAALLGVHKVKHLGMGGWRLPVNWVWVRKGASVSLSFLLATLALRGVQTIDRYWVQSLSNTETVGAYVLFLSIAGTLMVFLDAGVFAFAYPELIALHHKQQHTQAHRKVKQLLMYVLLAAAVFSGISWLLLPYLLQWINKPLYMQSIGLYPWLLLATAINALGMAPHYALYAQGRDKVIIGSHMGAMPVFVLAVWLLGQTMPTLAVPIGLVIFFSVILLIKAVAYWSGEHAAATTPA